MDKAKETSFKLAIVVGTYTKGSDSEGNPVLDSALSSNILQTLMTPGDKYCSYGVKSHNSESVVEF
jgi:hypothetical protein